MQNHFTEFRVFTFPVNRNAMVVAEGPHALLHPRMTPCGAYTKPVENGCDIPIRQQCEWRSKTMQNMAFTSGHNKDIC